MKLTIQLALLFMSSGLTAFAQYTQGGSKKNYERYHVTYDSVVNETKVPIEGFTNHVCYDFAYVSPTNDWSKQQMTQSEYSGNPYYAAPFATGKVGLTRGFSFGISGISPLNSVNKNLIPNVDIGLAIKAGYTGIAYNWKNIYTDPSFYFYDLFNDDPSYGIFSMAHFGIGPSVSYIPNPTHPTFAIDVYSRLNLFAAFAPNFSNYVSTSEGWLDLETERTGTKLDLSPTLGVNLRFSSFKIFMENNFNISAQNNSNSILITENMEIYDGWSINNYVSSFSLSKLLMLSNFQIGIGAVISN